MDHGLLIEVEFPFPGKSFPPELGAIVQRTVLAGEEPARHVGHTPANSDEIGSEWRVRQFAYGPESNQAEAFDTVRDSGTRIEMLCANATHPTV
jgi:hypothetical protein